ncbi:helix-turn-helix domain-containing protein (plasmid) [Nocardia sp. NBC_01377]|uniref:helix-turn-helix domain-containing protein n=1 Tax=Nocardia sp. NBC_01377 TaxID=2903595 RepID=UPI002F916AFB
MIALRWYPPQIRALRRAAMLSQQEFAKHLGVTRRTVIFWENNRTTTPNQASRRLLQRMLEGSDEQVRSRFEAMLKDPMVAEGYIPIPAAVGFEGPDRREFLVALAGALMGSAVQLSRWHVTLPATSSPLPAQIGASDVTRLRMTADQIRDLDSRFGGGAAVDPSLGALSRGAAMLPRCRNEDVLRQLYVALADLSNIVAWAHHDAGQQRQARLHLAQGVRWASEAATAEAYSLCADLLFGLARVELHEREPDAALEMVQLGQIAAAKAADTAATAQLHATAAWAYAHKGADRLMRDSLARAEHEMALAPMPREPWMQVFYTSGDYVGHQALVHGVLAANSTDPRIAMNSAARAVELTTIARGESGPDRPARSKLFDDIVAATNHFRVDDPATAIPITERAIAGLGTIATQRGIDRLPELIAAARPHAADSGVIDLIEQVEQLVTA